MKKNVLLNNGDSDFLRNIFEDLHNENKLNFSLFLYTDNLKTQKSNAKSLDLRKIYIEKIDLFKDKSKIDNELLEYITINCEKSFYNQLERLCVSKLSNNQKLIILKNFLIRINEILKNNQISHLFFQTTPHMGFDYLLFHAANFYKIKTFIFFRTYYENLIIVSEDYRFRKFKPIENKNIFLKDNNDIEKLNSSVWYNLGKKINNESKNKSNFLTGIFSFHLLLIKKIKYLIFNKQINSFHSLEGKINIFFYIYLHFKHLIKTYFLRKNYFQFSKNIKYKNLKYVFYAMHNQPEKTTNPEGEGFEDNLTAINFLRMVLPKEIKILVKEHPKQLNMYSGDVRQLKFRNFEYYKKIKNLNNVELVPIDIKTDVLIENSILNCTITGTVAWESLLKKKPAISFGNTWHSNCNSTPVISRDPLHAKKQIEILINKTEKDIKNDLSEFFKINSKFFFNSTISDFELQNTSENNEILFKNMKNLVEQLL